MLTSGIEGSTTAKVTEEMTALALESGELHVLATPKLAALVEKSAWQSIKDELEEGQTSVGTRLELDHLSPTAVGMTLRCKTVLTKIDRRKLYFTFEATDDVSLVAKGTHERFIVDAKKFQIKADERIDKH